MGARLRGWASTGPACGEGRGGSWAGEVDLRSGLEIERQHFAGLFATQDRTIGMNTFWESGPRPGEIRRTMTIMTPPTVEQMQQAWDDLKLANLLYHDWEADSYDDKWSISFDERCITYARDRFVNVAGEADWPYGSALELGCGTGFFLLNLKLAGCSMTGM